MSDEVSREVAIRNMRGLHARAAAKFCDMAADFISEITVTKDDTTVGICSLMALLMLGAGIGTSITVAAKGPDAEEAVSALAALIENRFDEAQ